jgi:hypothetical protein
MQDEEILGGFYDYELLRVGNSEMYQTEKVLKTRTPQGKKQLLVHWQDTTLILIRGYLPKIFIMSEGFYVTFMSNISDPLYDNLNMTSDF